MPNAFPKLIRQHTGHFPDLVTIQEVTTTQSVGFGEEIQTATDVLNLTDLRCRVTPASLTEQMEASERRFPNRTQLVAMRRVAIPQYLPQIVPAMRAVFEGDTWNVVAVQAEEHVSLTRLLVEQVTL